MWRRQGVSLSDGIPFYVVCAPDSGPPFTLCSRTNCGTRGFGSIWGRHNSGIVEEFSPWVVSHSSEQHRRLIQTPSCGEGVQTFQSPARNSRARNTAGGLLFFCASTRANYPLRAVPPALSEGFVRVHDTRVFQSCWEFKPKEHPGTLHLPFCHAGLGLASAVLSRSAACWANWAANDQGPPPSHRRRVAPCFG